MRIVQANLKTGGLVRSIARAVGGGEGGDWLARLALKEGEKLAADAKDVAEEILHRRPDNRRTKESLEHGNEYHDSYTVTPRPSQGLGAVVVITNDHPAHPIIEKGSRRHPIEARGDQPMVFPWDPPSTRGTSTQKGVFPIEHGGMQPFESYQVDHPGTAPKRILASALDRYKAKTPHTVRTM